VIARDSDLNIVYVIGAQSNGLEFSCRTTETRDETVQVLPKNHIHFKSHPRKNNQLQRAVIRQTMEKE